MFSRIRTKYDKILRIFSYSVRIWENADQNNSKYGHFLCSAYCKKKGGGSFLQFLNYMDKIMFAPSYLFAHKVTFQLPQTQ